MNIGLGHLLLQLLLCVLLGGFFSSSRNERCQSSTKYAWALATNHFFESALRDHIFALISLDQILKALSYDHLNLTDLQQVRRLPSVKEFEYLTLKQLHLYALNLVSISCIAIALSNSTCIIPASYSRVFAAILLLIGLFELFTLAYVLPKMVHQKHLSVENHLAVLIFNLLAIFRKHYIELAFEGHKDGFEEQSKV